MRRIRIRIALLLKDGRDYKGYAEVDRREGRRRNRFVILVNTVNRLPYTIMPAV